MTCLPGGCTQNEMSTNKSGGGGGGREGVGRGFAGVALLRCDPVRMPCALGRAQVLWAACRYAVKMEREVLLCLHALPSLVRGKDGNPIMSHVELGPTNSETHLRNWVQVLMSCKAILGPRSLQRLYLSVLL